MADEGGLVIRGNGVTNAISHAVSAMSVCQRCGQAVEFRTIDGVRIPYHFSGRCPGQTGRPVDMLDPPPAYFPCPKCGNRAWFLRHNGGSFWVDALGPPWPKHPCFDGAAFVGKRPFTVGKQVWQNCDFCAAIMPRERYAAHVVSEHTTARDRLFLERVERGRDTAPSKSSHRLSKPSPPQNLNTQRPQPTPVETEVSTLPMKETEYPSPTVATSSKGPTFTNQSCDCGGSKSCIICGGRGWFIKHRDGKLSAGRKT